MVKSRMRNERNEFKREKTGGNMHGTIVPTHHAKICNKEMRSKILSFEKKLLRYHKREHRTRFSEKIPRYYVKYASTSGTVCGRTIINSHLFQLRSPNDQV